MNILHVLSRLTVEAECAVADLIGQQRDHGHAVTWVAVDPHPGAALPPRDGEPPDVVHAHGLVAAQVASADRVTVSETAPLLVTAHEWIADEHGFRVPPSREVLRSVACVTTPSALGGSLATAAGIEPRRIRLIPYPVYPAPPLTASDRELDRELTAWRTQGGDVFCAVGDRTGGAFHDIVIEALSSVTQCDSLLCVLAGFPNKPACEQSSATRTLGPRVRFSPSQESARAIAARSDYVALPTFDTRRPFALAEAWCDGVPVLAGRNPRFADLDASGHGTVFFDATDSSDLARAIATVRGTTSASRRLLVERARAQYRRQFAPSAVFAAYEAAYADVLNHSRIHSV